MRALTILDVLIQNAGGRFQRTFADEALLERLRTLPRDDLVDATVRQKCNKLFRQWAVVYKSTPGLSAIVELHKQLPTRAKPHASQSRVVRQNDAEAAAENPFGEDPPSPPLPQAQTLPESRKASTSRPAGTHASGSKPATSSSTPSFFGHSHRHSRDKDKDKKKKAGKAQQPFSLEREKGKILQAIASASMTSTNLVNALQRVNRESSRVSDDAEVVRCFETCKLLRRQILRYIQLVESDEWIGGLLTANDDLVKALMAYEIMDKSIEDDSDSEYEQLAADGASAAHGQQQQQQPPRRPSRLDNSMAAMSLDRDRAPAKPPRPSAPPAGPSASRVRQSDSEAEDEDDPFGDRNEV